MLYHLTPAYNVEAIQNEGILVNLAVSLPQRIWLATRAASMRFARHIAGRHFVRRDELVAFLVSEHHLVLTRRGGGLFTVASSIPPHRLMGSFPVTTDFR